MSKQDRRPDDVRQIFGGILANLGMFAIFCYLIYLNIDKLIPLWRGLRLAELSAWHGAFSFVGIDYFDHWLSQLKRTPPHRINWTYVAAFEASLNHHLRFVYGSIMGYFAVKSWLNYRKVTHVFTVQSMMEAYSHV
ncbi:hypothetical protein ERJ77_25155, partial [Vibrio anguillarum]|nr:hypothetical protein [Vibrio anguillarum]